MGKRKLAVKGKHVLNRWHPGLKQRGPVSGPSGAIRILRTEIKGGNLDL